MHITYMDYFLKALAGEKSRLIHSFEKIFFTHVLIAATLTSYASGGIEAGSDIGQVEITAVSYLKKGDKYTSNNSEKTAAADIVLVYASAKSPSKVKIAIALPKPERWNGRWLSLGNGGIGSQLSAEAAANAAAYGFAAAHCNLGTSPLDKPDFKQMIKDFGHEAVFKMTYAGLKLAESFYGRKPSYSYYVGGSTGGQEGLSLAERHPELIDGVVVYFPVTNRTRLHARMAFENLILSPKNYFTDSEILKITESIVSQNKAFEPENSKPYLQFPEYARVDYSKLDFLSAEQVEVLKKLHSKLPYLNAEKNICWPAPPSSEIADGGKTLKKGFPCWFPKWVYGEKINDKNFDLNDYFLKLENMFAEDMNALPNLKPFFEKGGKLLILQGKLDTIVPAEYVKEYYRELCNNIGGYQKTMESARLFLIPGAWHGNFKSDISAYIRGWVEENKAPEKIEVEVDYLGKKYSETLFPYSPDKGAK